MEPLCSALSQLKIFFFLLIQFYLFNFCWKHHSLQMQNYWQFHGFTVRPSNLTLLDHTEHISSLIISLCYFCIYFTSPSSLNSFPDSHSVFPKLFKEARLIHLLLETRVFLTTLYFCANILRLTPFPVACLNCSCELLWSGSLFFVNAYLCFTLIKLICSKLGVYLF